MCELQQSLTVVLRDHGANLQRILSSTEEELTKNQTYENPKKRSRFIKNIKKNSGKTCGKFMYNLGKSKESMMT